MIHFPDLLWETVALTKYQGLAKREREEREGSALGSALDSRQVRFQLLDLLLQSLASRHLFHKTLVRLGDCGTTHPDHLSYLMIGR